MLMHRVRNSNCASEAIIDAGWACSPACIFLFMAVRKDEATHSQRAEAVLPDIVLLQAPYLGIKRMKSSLLDRRIWGLIAEDQLHTIREAASIANMVATQ